MLLEHPKAYKVSASVWILLLPHWWISMLSSWDLQDSRFCSFLKIYHCHPNTIKVLLLFGSQYHHTTCYEVLLLFGCYSCQTDVFYLLLPLGSQCYHAETWSFCSFWKSTVVIRRPTRFYSRLDPTMVILRPTRFWSYSDPITVLLRSTKVLLPFWSHSLHPDTYRFLLQFGCYSLLSLADDPFKLEFLYFLIYNNQSWFPVLARGGWPSPTQPWSHWRFSLTVISNLVICT